MLLNRSALEVVRLCAKPEDDAVAAVTHVFEELLQLARTTKALGATALKLTFHEDPVAPIHIAASVDGIDGAVEGALMPMRE